MIGYEKNILLLLILIGFVPNNFAQTDSVAWQYYPGIKIIKTGTKLRGADTLSVYKVYQGWANTDSVFLKEGRDTTFLFFENNFYFLYANSAQIGDFWHPLKFVNNSFKDTCGFLNLKVIAIDSVLINGDWLNEIILEDQEDWGWGNWGYIYVVEKIGVLHIGGGIWYNFGMLYNYLYPACSGGNTDIPPLCLISYYSQALSYTYAPTYDCTAGLEENSMQNEPLIKRQDNRIEVTWNEKDVELELYNISGQKVKSAQKNSMILPQEQGIYFLHIQQNLVSRVVKLAN